MRTIRIIGVLAVMSLSLLFLGNDSLLAQTDTSEPTLVGATLDDLRARADRDGHVRVIVGLDTGKAFLPDGTLSAFSATAQRGQINHAQSMLLKAAGLDKTTIQARYKYVPYMALSLDRQALDRLIASGRVTTLQEDRADRAALTAETTLIHADMLWASGYDGEGWVIAVLDTGIDEDHPFFGDRIIQADQACFSTQDSASGKISLCPDGSSNQVGTNAANAMTSECLAASGNLCDHGTHVAGIAAGNAAGVGGEPGSGVAPRARILPIQVFTRVESGSGCTASVPCRVSYVADQIAALEYVYDLRATYHFAAVNMSVASDTTSATACDAAEPALTAIIDTLLSADIPTVIASGDSGSGTGISAPGCISSAVTVGATENDDTIASFSNRSATLLDLFAPGTGVRSSIPNNAWISYSGTSMSAPIVSGSFAVLREARPSSSVAAILAAMQDGGVPVLVGGTPIGRVDLAAALNLLNGANSPPYPPRSPTPASSLIGVSASTSLTWEGGDPDSGNTVTYDVYLDANNPPTTLECDDAATASCAVSGLSTNTIYFWKVVATDSHSAVTTGPVWAFRTTGGGTAPINDAIENALHIGSDTFSLIQSTVGATEVAGDPKFPYPCVSPASKRYNTVWFEYTPSATGKLDVNTADSDYDTVLGVWTGSPGSLTNLECNDDALDNGLDFIQTSEISNLTVYGGTQYYIEVAGLDSGDEGTLKLRTGLNIFNSLPRVPSSPSPANNSSAANTSLTLSWIGGDSDPGDTVTYDVFLDTSTAPSTLVCDDITAQSCPVSGLSALTIYRWKVVATDNHAGSVTSPVWKFTTADQPPYTPANPSPADGAGGILKTTILTWTSGDPDAGDTVTYDVLMGATQTTVTTLVCNDVPTMGCIPSPTPDGNAEVYWKVIAMDNHGASAFGPVWHFSTINTPPNTPSNPSPANGGSASLNPTLTWTGGDTDTGATVSYDVYLYPDGSPAALACDDVDVEVCTPAGPLTNGQLYRWYVVATDDQGASTTGPTWSFTAQNHAPDAPSNPSPANGATASLNPTLTWTGGDPDPGDTVTYDVFLNSALVCDDVAAATCTPAGPLTDGQTYDWYVVAADNHGASTTGTTWSFTAQNNPPSAPSNPSPADNATGVSLTPTLTWTSGDPDPGDVLTYDVYLYPDGGSAALACDDVSPAECAPAGTLLAGTLYHWYVVVTDNHGAGTTGPVWSFTTVNHPPNAPDSPSPAHGATLVQTDPTFTWTGGDPDPGDTVTYDVFVDTKSKPASLACNDVAVESCALPGHLPFNAKIYWKVVATDNHGASTTGPVWSFTVAAAPPALNSPKNGSVSSKQLPKFSWKAVKSATAYHLQISEDPDDWSAPVFQKSDVPKNSYVYLATNTPPQLDYGTYYWRVAAFVGGAWTDWSTPFSFDIALNKSPKKNSAVTKHMTSFSWSGIKGATYDLEVFLDDDTCTDPPLIWVYGHPKTSYKMLSTDPVPELDFGQYYWHVRAIVDGTPTSYGPCWLFDVTSLKSPKNGSAVSSLLPKFSWGANKVATGYNLTVQRVPPSGPPPAPLVRSALTSPSYKSMSGDFTEYGRYVWHIQEIDGYGSPTPDFELYLTIMSKPANNTFTLDNTPAFSWKKISGATYILQIADASDPDFISPIRTYPDITSTKYTVPLADGLPRGQYLWRIVTTGGVYEMPGWLFTVGP